MSEKIEFNKEYRYKELCEVFDMKPITNRQKTIKAIGKNYLIEKHGAKYIILKKYTEEEKTVVGWSTKFTGYIEYMIIKMLQQTHYQDTVVCMSYRDIMEKFCMVNSHYFPVKNGHEDLYIEMPKGYDEGVIVYNKQMWFQLSNQMLRHTIDQALKSIENRQLIIANKSFRGGQRVKISEDSDVELNITHECNEAECKQILGIQESVLRKHGLQKMSQLYQLDKERALMLREEMKNKVKAEMDYDWYVGTFRIIKGSTIHQYPVDRMDFNLPNAQEQLNENVIQKLLQSKTMGTIPQKINEQMVCGLIKKP